MVEKVSLNIEIGNKSDLELILGSSDLVQKNELHVQRGKEYSKEIASADSNFSIALVAMADGETPNYTIGYINNVKVILNNVQASPLIINNGMVQRALEEFTENSIYPTYKLMLVSPRTDWSELLGNKGTLAPYATPDRAYQK